MREVNGAVESWKTTAVGVLMIAWTAWRVYNDPSAMNDQMTVANFLAGLGLILAKDGDHTEAAKRRD